MASSRSGSRYSSKCRKTSLLRAILVPYLTAVTSYSALAPGPVTLADQHRRRLHHEHEPPPFRALPGPPDLHGPATIVPAAADTRREAYASTRTALRLLGELLA